MSQQEEIEEISITELDSSKIFPSMEGKVYYYKYKEYYSEKQIAKYFSLSEDEINKNMHEIRLGDDTLYMEHFQPSIFIKKLLDDEEVFFCENMVYHLLFTLKNSKKAISFRNSIFKGLQYHCWSGISIGELAER